VIASETLHAAMRAGKLKLLIGGILEMEEVLAPMPGNIIEILVSVGDEVKEDDELLILEAMKMENPICAPADGTVKEIKVKEKDVVEADQLLIVLE
jgi:acetyl-CoA carboxylase biotin carboxyl carrier protein